MFRKRKISDNNPTWTDRGQFWIDLSISVVTLALFALNYYQARISKDATSTAIDALTYTKMKDSLDNIQRINADRANKKFIDSSLHLAKINTDASVKLAIQSIQSLSDARERFEVENQPFLRFVPILNQDDSIHYRIHYRLINYGKLPIQRVANIVSLSIRRNDIGQSDKRDIDSLKSYLKFLVPNEEGTVLITNDPRDFEILQFGITLNNRSWEQIEAGTIKHYITGKMKYKNAQKNASIKEYEFIIKLVLERPQNSNVPMFSYKYLYTRDEVAIQK